MALLKISELQRAIEMGDLDAVTAALDGGADLEEADMHGFPGLPLRTACFHGHARIVAELLRRGADVRAPNAQGAGAPIRMAARRKHREIIGMLLTRGADIPPGVDLGLGEEEIARYRLIAAVDERRAETGIMEIEVSPGELEALFGNSLGRAAERKQPGSEVGKESGEEGGWDRITRVD